MSGKRCPRCNLINPAVAMRCDCDYAFTEDAPPLRDPKPLAPHEKHTTTNNLMFGGAGLLILAGMFTLASIAQGEASTVGVAYYPNSSSAVSCSSLPAW